MDRYVRAYRSNDLETFMSFFSEDAVENNSLRYRDIRKAYAITFEEKINYYQISNMVVAIKGPNVFVSGTYTLSRYDSRETRWMKFEGRITWHLRSDQDRLLITSVNYDR